MSFATILNGTFRVKPVQYLPYLDSSAPDYT